MTSAKLNTGTFRICARVFLPHGIAYPLNSSEKLRRVHLQGFAILYSSTLRIIFAGGNGKFRGSLTAEHLQLPILLGLLDKGEHQFSFKMGAGLQHILCSAKNEGHIIAMDRELCHQPCLHVCCGQRAAIILDADCNLFQNGDRTLLQNLADFVHCLRKCFCVHYRSFHAAFLLGCFSSTVCIRIVLVEKSVWSAIFSPWVRML